MQVSMSLTILQVMWSRKEQKTEKQQNNVCFQYFWQAELDKTTCKGTRHLCSKTLQNFLTRLNNQIFNKVFNFKVHCVYTSVPSWVRKHLKYNILYLQTVHWALHHVAGRGVFEEAAKIYGHILQKYLDVKGNIWKLQQLIWRYCSHFSAADSTTIYYLLRFLHSRSSRKLIKYKLLLTMHEKSQRVIKIKKH